MQRKPVSYARIDNAPATSGSARSECSASVGDKRPAIGVERDFQHARFAAFHGRRSGIACNGDDEGNFD